MTVLLAAQADPDMARFDGATAIALACQNGHDGVVQALIDAGCDIEATVTGFTPLFVAASFNFPRIVEILVRAGADIHARSKTGATPLHAAQSRGYRHVAEILQAAVLDAKRAVAVRGGVAGRTGKKKKKKNGKKVATVVLRRDQLPVWFRATAWFLKTKGVAVEGAARE